jgi:hypothetical protein
VFSNELANKMIKLPKTILGGETSIDLSREKTRLRLVNAEEPDYEFLCEITSHRKIMFKISLHHQEDKTKEGLLRIDFKGGHKNPETLTEFVPENVRPYLGYYFENEAHVHIYVEGYKDLAWAVPIADYNFPVKTINNTDDFIKAIQAFSQELNIVTPFTIQNTLA